MKNQKVIIWVLIMLGLIIFSKYQPYDATDDQINKTRSGLGLYKDHGTGCHYIKGGFFTSITPRLDRDGNHICE